MTAPKPRPGIMNIKPYVPGSSSAPGAQKVYKLSSNESALGASPKAVEAYQRAAQNLFLYPDGGSTVLREKIGEKHKLNPANIICGAGSDEILQLLTKAYVGEGDNIIQTEHGFLVYALAAMAVGAAPRFAKETHLKTNIETILDLVDARTRIVFIANPNNPTGTYIAASALRDLRARLREDVILVIDSAYAEFMEEQDYEDGAALVEENNNVVMTRTFSKIYGLAALRLGWGYFPSSIADALNRIRGPFNVTLPAQAAGVAALEDDDFVDANRKHNRAEREKLYAAFENFGLDYTPSHGNFVLVRFPEERGLCADDIQAYLREGGVIVREMGPYKLGDCLRISIGERQANEKLVALLSTKFSHG